MNGWNNYTFMFLFSLHIEVYDIFTDSYSVVYIMSKFLNLSF